MRSRSSWQYATQDADPKVFEPLRKPIHERAAAFRKRLVDTEPRHVDAVLEFAARAYRRPLTAEEKQELRGAVSIACESKMLPHDDAIRLTLARMLVAPAFSIELEKPGPASESIAGIGFRTGDAAELFPVVVAARRRAAAVAASGRCAIRPCSWSKRGECSATTACGGWRPSSPASGCTSTTSTHSTKRANGTFPTFAALRGAMYEESIRFFTDLFQRDGSVLEHSGRRSHVSERAAREALRHPRRDGRDWRRVEGVKQLRPRRHPRPGHDARQAVRRVADQPDPAGQLGQRSAARRKASASAQGRAAVAAGRGRHQWPHRAAARRKAQRRSRIARSAIARIDAYGYALEGFDAIGRLREKDLGGRPIDTRAKAMDGAKFDGLDGLRGYLLTTRRDAFLRQFCRKLLGYALGRAVQLSDEPLLAEMQRQLRARLPIQRRVGDDRAEPAVPRDPRPRGRCGSMSEQIAAQCRSGRTASILPGRLTNMLVESASMSRTADFLHC